MIVKLKQMHINLTDEKQVSDYEIVKRFYSVQSDNDLVRMLFATEAARLRGGWDVERLYEDGPKACRKEA